MQAVIRAGGKQYKVSKGDVIEVERSKNASDSVEFTPLLVIDDKGKTVSSKSDLAAARVKASVVGDSQGPKVDVYKYRNKTGYRRHTGHRQKYVTLQISDITLKGSGDKKSTAAKKTEEENEDGT